MRIKKMIISLMLLLPFIMSASGFGSIKVTMIDGSTTIISMSERPVVKFIGDKLVVKTDVTTTEFERSKVKTFNYHVSSSIGKISIGNNIVNNTGDNLLFDNLPVDSEITVHDVSGKLVKSVLAAGRYKLNIMELTAGVYVVSVNGISTKIAVKR